MPPIELERYERLRFHQLDRKARRRLIERLRDALSRYDFILLAVVHGSILRDHPFRDVDVAVYTGGDVDPLDCKLRLDEELSKNLGYPVDVRVLDDAPHWFTLNVLEIGEVLLERVQGLVEGLYKKALDERAFIEGGASERLG